MTSPESTLVEELTPGDIDFAIALDLDDFANLQNELSTMGWTQDAKREERWRSKAGALLDLIPAGNRLRESKRFTWPKGQNNDESCRLRSCVRRRTSSRQTLPI